MNNTVTSINLNYRACIYQIRLLLMLMLSALLMLPVTVNAGSAAVYIKTVDKSVEAVYPVLYKSLEDSRFFVVFETLVEVVARALQRPSPVAAGTRKQRTPSPRLDARSQAGEPAMAPRRPATPAGAPTRPAAPAGCPAWAGPGWAE